MSFRVAARRVASALGVLPLAFAGYKFIREFRPAMYWRNRQLRRAEAQRRIPVPPGDLLYLVNTSRDVRWFLDGGESTAKAIRDALSAIGRPIESFAAVLDFGCGCGRILRQWHEVRGPRFSGTDYNPAGLAWVQRHLSHVTTATNQLEPPLPFGNGSFDLVYSISVFTHLPEALQKPWLDEMHRVLEPHGVFIATLMGESFAQDRLTVESMAAFKAGALVERDAEFAGSNLCATYHPPAWVHANITPKFRVLLHLPAGAGRSEQDLWMFQRRD